MITGLPSKGRLVPEFALNKVLGLALCASVLSACDGGDKPSVPKNDALAGTQPSIASVAPDVAVTPPDIPATTPDIALTPPDIPVTPPNMVATPQITPAPDLECSAERQKQWAYDALRDYYLFYDQVPNANLQDFESSRDVVQSLRYQERDPYSSISDAQVSQLESVAGREFRLGYRWVKDSAGLARVQKVTQNSPFDLAGVKRGDIILGVDGFDWFDEELNIGFRDRTIGNPDNPSTAMWQFQKGESGDIVTLEITAAEYDIATVARSRIIVNPGWEDKIGYLVFERFLGTSEAELNSAFRGFKEQKISDLILDLRYNRGGLIRIAEQLASLIAGNDLAGQLLYEYRHNEKYPTNDEDLYFRDTAFGLGMQRLIVLTSPETASSSEIVIAGLQAYINVVTIGGSTEGKPFISSPNDRCGERLSLMKAEGFNAANVSVDGGIQASCYAADDPTRDFGLNNGEYENLFRAGINYIIDGTCPAQPLISANRLALTKAGQGHILPEERQERAFTAGALLD